MRFSDRLSGIGGGFDNTAIGFEGIEYVAKHCDAQGKQQDVGPDQGGQQGGDDDATYAEEYNQMTGDGERVVTHQQFVLRLSRPPTGRLTVGRTLSQAAAHTIKYGRR